MSCTDVTTLRVVHAEAAFNEFALYKIVGDKFDEK